MVIFFWQVNIMMRQLNINNWQVNIKIWEVAIIIWQVMADIYMVIYSMASYLLSLPDLLLHCTWYMSFNCFQEALLKAPSVHLLLQFTIYKCFYANNWQFWCSSSSWSRTRQRKNALKFSDFNNHISIEGTLTVLWLLLWGKTAILEKVKNIYF